MPIGCGKPVGMLLRLTFNEGCADQLWGLWSGHNCPHSSCQQPQGPSQLLSASSPRVTPILQRPACSEGTRKKQTRPDHFSPTWTAPRGSTHSRASLQLAEAMLCLSLQSCSLHFFSLKMIPNKQLNPQSPS